MVIVKALQIQRRVPPKLKSVVPIEPESYDIGDDKNTKENCAWKDIVDEGV